MRQGSSSSSDVDPHSSYADPEVKKKNIFKTVPKPFLGLYPKKNPTNLLVKLCVSINFIPLDPDPHH